MSWTAVVLDDNGLPASSDFGPVVMSIAAGPAGFTASSTTQTNAVFGTANFSNLALDTSGYYTVQASFGDSTITAPLVVTPPPALFLTQPANASAGAILNSVEVAAGTADGSVDTNYEGPITLTLSSGTFASGQNTVTAQAQNGIAAFSTLTINVARTYTLSASDAVGAAAVSSRFTITPAASYQLSFLEEPSEFASQQTGQPIKPVEVAVEDEFDNVVTSDTSSISVTATNAVGKVLFASGSITTLAASQGVATFADRVPDVMDNSYTLTATDANDSLTDPTTVSLPFPVTFADNFSSESSSSGGTLSASVWTSTPLFKAYPDVSGGFYALGTATTNTATVNNITQPNEVVAATFTIEQDPSLGVASLTGSLLADYSDAKDMYLGQMKYSGGLFQASILKDKNGTLTTLAGPVTISTTGTGNLQLDVLPLPNGGDSLELLFNRSVVAMATDASPLPAGTVGMTVGHFGVTVANFFARAAVTGDPSLPYSDNFTQTNEGAQLADVSVQPGRRRHGCQWAGSRRGRRQPGDGQRHRRRQCRGAGQREPGRRAMGRSGGALQWAAGQRHVCRRIAVHPGRLRTRHLAQPSRHLDQAGDGTGG